MAGLGVSFFLSIPYVFSKEDFFGKWLLLAFSFESICTMIVFYYAFPLWIKYLDASPGIIQKASDTMLITPLIPLGWAAVQIYILYRLYKKDQAA
jgi:hypothetical protein